MPLTHVLALRLGAHGVRVNCIAAACRSTARIAGTPGTW